ncbi:MAG: ribosome biogenesis GTPase Der [Eubacteriales bacterium]|nr:ribosome biogenesis GTPase Der [Clostridiales bacterium]MDD7394187.1 ribosome biogenesis GTPase Der [Eubacteriales bacterium]MDY3759966.1 ribosome biogenesis GTPase Der [Eubacteriales bacterium]
MAIVAVVGRPNVGKSSLFNKIVNQRLSIVEDTPGVTRDRIYCDTEWNGVKFTLVDTGGIEPRSDDVILSQMRAQAQIAIDKADVVIMVVDIQSGMTSTDADVAQMLLKANKKVVLCVNKVDRPGAEPPEIYEFYNLGLGDPFGVSAVHGLGIGDLLDEVVRELKDAPEEPEYEGAVKVALIGKPNVGKSSLVNYMLGENRMLVSDIPGTTRDAVDSVKENKYGKFVFIDTAGLRKKSKVSENIERYSVVRSYMAVDRADVVLIMIDANEGVTEQDTKIAGFAHDRGKASVIVVNKWDVVEKDDKTMNRIREKVVEDLKYMSYAPVVFISAKTGQRVEKLYELINYVHEQHGRRVSTGVLNDVLADATMKVQPPTDKGKRLKIFYITQPSTNPPTFVAFCNDAELFHFSYQRYLENQIRQTFGLEGTPIRFIVREKNEKDK